jgi:hypothetical protein
MTRSDPVEDLFRPTWRCIIEDLERLSAKSDKANDISELAGEVGFPAREFAIDFKANARQLAALTRDLVLWLREQLRRVDCISVLGM